MDAVILLIQLAIIVFMVVSMWKVFEKAGQPGWAAIVPFYNIYVLTTGVAMKEVLWFILCLVPFVNFIAIILISIDVAKRFGKGAGFGIGLAFLGFIFYPILAFSDARHDSQLRDRRRSGGRDYGDYDDDDDRPRKKKARYDDDADDDRPRRGRRDDDE
jgi:uncharacterized ferritin-like protein (DUF455 family)